MTALQSQTAFPRYRRWIGVLLGSGGLVNYFDRINLEEPGVDEHVITVLAHGSIQETVTDLLSQVRARDDNTS